MRRHAGRDMAVLALVLFLVMLAISYQNCA